MKLLLALCACCVLGLVGCARSTVSLLVPRLELSLRLARAREAGLHDDRTRVVLGAWLRWQPRIDDLAGGGALSLAASITPCEVGDASCLIELSEAEPEVAALAVEAP